MSNPGPMQRLILMVLNSGKQLTTDQIAAVLSDACGNKIGYGSVRGALSGMVNMANRNWVKRHEHPMGKTSQDQFSITVHGQMALFHGRREAKINGQTIYSGLHDKNSFTLQLDTDGDVVLTVVDGHRNQSASVHVTKDGLEHMRRFVDLVFEKDETDD